MLTLLKIRNLALVDELVWEPATGFLAITGETGAGKSVIMGGISLILGERAEKGRIRSGESQCCLEASFHLPHPDEVNARLEEAGVPPCEEGDLLIRRLVTTTGNRQFINNTPVTLQFLKLIGSGLADMHHPEAHRSLTSQARQLCLLDAFAENEKERMSYDQAYRHWLASQKAYRELLEGELLHEREIDFLRHQVDEIERAGFTREEASGLEVRWQRARNASRLRDTVLPMVQAIGGEENGALSRLRSVVRAARELERLDASCASWLAPLDGIVEELEELAVQLEDYAERLSGDPAEQSMLEERISLLDTLKRKYGADYDAILRHLEDCRERLGAIDHREELLREREQQEKEDREELRKAAAALSSSRRKAAPRLEKAFLEHARQLGFLQSLFEVRLTPRPEPGPHGAEETDFLFGPNPGEPLQPLRAIASSGEMARVMLALKSALTRQDDTPLLVFDEIDANVGGGIARAVGLKMRELGQSHQVVAITHFPQVAALADHHYLISKGEKEGRTVSHLQEVASEDRVSEIMRMLGASGTTAKAHARSLLQQG